MTMPPISIGSPSGVPVACPSTNESPRSGTPASVNTLSSNRAWAIPFGAVRLALRPSCCTAEPPKHGKACRSIPYAKMALLHDSPRSKPSARLSNEWHRPRTDVMPATEPEPSCSAKIRFTPVTIWCLHSSCCSARAAE